MMLMNKVNTSSSAIRSGSISSKAVPTVSRNVVVRSGNMPPEAPKVRANLLYGRHRLHQSERATKLLRFGTAHQSRTRFFTPLAAALPHPVGSASR